VTKQFLVRKNFFGRNGVSPPPSPGSTFPRRFETEERPGIDVMIKKKIHRNIWRKYWRFLLKLQLVFAKI
jgi:hypothetical protein